MANKIEQEELARQEAISRQKEDEKRQRDAKGLSEDSVGFSRNELI